MGVKGIEPESVVFTAILTPKVKVLDPFQLNGSITLVLSCGLPRSFFGEEVLVTQDEDDESDHPDAHARGMCFEARR